MSNIRWTGFPKPTRETLEYSAVSLMRKIEEWKREHDHLEAVWIVGTATDYSSKPVARLFRRRESRQPAMALSTLDVGAPEIAAMELAEYHGMRLEGATSPTDATIYVYTDRHPTRGEKRRRPKEVLTVKQKRVYRAIRCYLSEHGKGPTKVELARIMGHRSTTTTNGFLKKFEEKNWIILDEGALQEVELT